MDQSEFDKFADEYWSLHRINVAISGELPDYFGDYKIRDLSRTLRARGDNAAPAVLDFGAGVGTSIPHFRKHIPGARLTCIDVSTKCLEVGRSRFAGQAEFVQCNGDRIPFPESSFDIAFAACVFHHIDAGEHVRLLSEFRRVLKPGGFAFIFEHNPLNPLTVRTVNACPFDENALLIRAGTLRERMSAAGLRDVRISYRVFFPHALRALRFLESRMTWLPLGAQYHAIGLR